MFVFWGSNVMTSTHLDLKILEIKNDLITLTCEQHGFELHRSTYM